MLTAEKLRELMDYNPDTGVFLYRKRRGRRSAGLEAGSIVKGYRLISLGKQYSAHRLAWLYVYGEWPAGDLDHINCVRDDNRIANLREATDSQNNANRTLAPKNSSGFKGVCWNKRC